MNTSSIAAIEQRYQHLLQELHAGRLSRSDFASAEADLYFQDELGRFWAIGIETGLWYYHDGFTWRPGDPHQPNSEQAGMASQPDAGPEDMLPPWRQDRFARRKDRRRITAACISLPARSVLVIGVALLMILAILALPVGGAPPLNGPAAAPSPRPPLGGSSAGGDGRDEEDDGAQGAILGTVTDLSTGQPGSGIEVVVNGFPPVHTDSNGHYSVTGLAAGEYRVTLEPQSSGTPGQGPVFVVVDGQSGTTVDLAYYSQAPASSVVGTQPQAATSPPPELPPSGAPVRPGMLKLAGVGLVLVLTGLALRHTSSGG